MNKLIYFLLTIMLIGACNESTSSENVPNDIRPVDSVTISEIDTLTIDTLVSSTSLEETPQLTNLNENSSLASYINYLHEKMENVKNPIRATYEGTDFGDYFHLSFRGPNELYLDFADGNNDFGKYELYDSLTFEENQKYVGKTFEIHWEYKISTFACCEGEMEAVTAKVPSITELKLIEQ